MEDYHLARSLLQGAKTRATNAGVFQPHIDRIDRWNTEGEELIDGPMRVNYSDRKQMLEAFPRFSRALKLSTTRKAFGDRSPLSA